MNAIVNALTEITNTIQNPENVPLPESFEEILLPYAIKYAHSTALLKESSTDPFSWQNLYSRWLHGDDGVPFGKNGYAIGVFIAIPDEYTHNLLLSNKIKELFYFVTHAFILDTATKKIYVIKKDEAMFKCDVACCALFSNIDMLGNIVN